MPVTDELTESLKKIYFIQNQPTLFLFNRTNNILAHHNYLFVSLNKRINKKKLYEKQIFNHTIKNFYKTNIISSNSIVMTKLTKENKTIKNFI